VGSFSGGGQLICRGAPYFLYGAPLYKVHEQGATLAGGAWPLWAPPDAMGLNRPTGVINIEVLPQGSRVTPGLILMYHYC